MRCLVKIGLNCRLILFTIMVEKYVFCVLYQFRLQMKVFCDIMGKMEKGLG